MNIEQQLDRALDLQRRGNFPEALARCEALLRVEPRNPWALQLAGVVLYQTGDLAGAAERLRIAVAIAPGAAEIWSNLAIVLNAAGRREAAANALKQAIKNAPQSPEYYSNLSSIQLLLGLVPEAEAAARGAVAADARYAPGWYNLALSLEGQARVLEALEAVGKAAALAPGEVPYSGLKAQLEDALGAREKARATLEAALARQPLATALRFQLAELLERSGHSAEAIEAYEQVLRLEPEHGQALSDLIFLRRVVADWTGLPALEKRYRSLAASGTVSLLSPFVLLSQQSTREEQRKCAETWTRALSVSRPPGRRRRLSHDRLRVGYLSSDFHAHATAHLAAGLFEQHDRSAFAIVGYSMGPDDGSPMRKRLERAFDRFVDARELDSSRLAATIHADHIDILVDLKGHTAGALPSVLALRPAPIQAHYLGYPGTLGGSLVDYLIGDRIVTPSEHAADYAETLIRLPGSYQVNDRERPIGPPLPRSALGLPENAVVLCNFNSTYKLNSAVLDAWATILQQVPAAVLWLLARNAADPAISNLRREGTARGIDPSRIVFAFHRPNPDYLALYSAADLFLDSWPYNAHTTGSDALWAGCPLLTWPGETFAGRVGASLLTAIGLPELIATDTADYIRRAVALARDAPARARLRVHLSGPGRLSPLFDTIATTRALEAAYRAMADQYRRIARAPIDL